MWNKTIIMTSNESKNMEWTRQQRATETCFGEQNIARNDQEETAEPTMGSRNN